MRDSLVTEVKIIMACNVWHPTRIHSSGALPLTHPMFLPILPSPTHSPQVPANNPADVWAADCQPSELVLVSFDAQLSSTDIEMLDVSSGPTRSGLSRLGGRPSTCMMLSAPSLKESAMLTAKTRHTLIKNGRRCTSQDMGRIVQGSGLSPPCPKKAAHSVHQEDRTFSFSRLAPFNDRPSPASSPGTFEGPLMSARESKFASVACSYKSLPSPSRSAEMQRNPPCWHEVVASAFVDPHLNQRVVLLVQRDVTEQQVGHEQLVSLLEAEHQLLESIFPRWDTLRHSHFCCPALATT
jgi:hypothetical protein